MELFFFPNEALLSHVCYYFSSLQQLQHRSRIDLSSFYILLTWGNKPKINKQANEKREQAAIDDKIESLQTMRANLVSKKMTVEKQLQDLEARMEEKKRKGLVSRGGSSTESWRTAAIKINKWRLWEVFLCSPRNNMSRFDERKRNSCLPNWSSQSIDCELREELTTDTITAPDGHHQAPPSSSSDRYKDGEGVDHCVCCWDSIAKGAESSSHCLAKLALAFMWCSWPRTSVIPVQSGSYAVGLEHGFRPCDQYRNSGDSKGKHDKCVWICEINNMTRRSLISKHKQSTNISGVLF